MTREEAIQNIKKAIGFSDTLDESIFTLFPELKEIQDRKKQEQPDVDLEKLALEKYPVEMVFRDPFDERNCDDGEEDINEYKRDAYLQGLKDGYELGKRR